MSDTTTTEGAETATEASTTPDAPAFEQYPADHPLVKALAAQKAQMKDLKAKANRLDEIEEAQKSEAEKVADRLAKADAEVASVPSKVCDIIKPILITTLGLDPEKDGQFLTATDPDLLVEQASRLAELSGRRKNVVPREGRSPSPGPSDPSRDFLRAINGQG